MSFPKMKLGECAEIHSGSTPRTNNPDFWDGDITWVTPKDLSKLKSKFILVSKIQINVNTTYLPQDYSYRSLKVLSIIGVTAIYLT